MVDAPDSTRVNIIKSWTIKINQNRSSNSDRTFENKKLCYTKIIGKEN